MIPKLEYHKKYLHTFQVRSLKTLGYKTRVTLNNKTHTRPEWADDSVVTMEVIELNPSTQLPQVVVQKNLGILATTEKMVVEVDAYLEELTSPDSVVIFYLTPKKIYEQEGDGTNFSKDRLWFYITAQDHYVEYYIDQKVATGLLYQCGAFNYEGFSDEANALIQAPKFYISDEINSYLSVVYTYFSNRVYRREDAKIKFKLVNNHGVSVVWNEELKPYTPYLFSLREILKKNNIQVMAQQTSFFCLYAMSSNATLVPVVFNQNERTKALTVEHSLPPIYYGQAVRGPSRKKSIDSLFATGFFEK